MSHMHTMYFAQVHSPFIPVPLLPDPEFRYPSPDSCTLLLSIFFFSLLSCHCHTLESPLGIAACVYMDAVVPAGARIAPGGPHPSRKWGFLPAAINCQQFPNEDGGFLATFSHHAGTLSVLGVLCMQLQLLSIHMCNCPLHAENMAPLQSSISSGS